jgi:DMSO/TMAO reductase YedYZ molybdopterin-dependent catalytic subunit
VKIITRRDFLVAMGAGLASLVPFAAGCARARALPQQTTPEDTVTPVPTPTETLIKESVLLIDGLVTEAQNFSYEDVTYLPALTEEAILFCPGVYENQPTREWSGVLISTIIDMARINLEANRMVFYSNDGYKTTVSLEKALGFNAILAYKVDGATLEKSDGYPFRLIIPDVNGDMWAKWVVRIEFA